MNSINSISQVLNATLDTKNKPKDSTNSEDFISVLKDTVSELNETQKKADIASAGIATGTVKDLHQAAITIDKAEINMKLMLEIRNKALSAYKDILRTQV